jgi:two-component system, OmpR family, response regulator
MAEPSVAPATNNRSKIVVGVDDMAESLSLVGHIVSDAGYVFMGAAGGAECLALVARIVPQFILLDVEMPKMDGFETCRRLRADWRLTHVPIAFLTARKTSEDVRKGMAVGGNDFVLKPFDRAKLIERLNYWTRHRVNKTW